LTTDRAGQFNPDQIVSVADQFNPDQIAPLADLRRRGRKTQRVDLELCRAQAAAAHARGRYTAVALEVFKDDLASEGGLLYRLFVVVLLKLFGLQKILSRDPHLVCLHLPIPEPPSCGDDREPREGIDRPRRELEIQRA
jgi:hypothetical protein